MKNNEITETVEIHQEGFIDTLHLNGKAYPMDQGDGQAKLRAMGFHLKGTHERGTAWVQVWVRRGK
ncbi:MAG: hypothetical protein GY847_28745 [Proteobacteria bacterium]|nr:hypothetical protein [Pseudomonadota bacterium]